jgi:hypothetical protein
MQTHLKFRPHHTFETEIISFGTAQTILTVLALATAIVALLELAVS